MAVARAGAEERWGTPRGTHARARHARITRTRVTGTHAHHARHTRTHRASRAHGYNPTRARCNLRAKHQAGGLPDRANVGNTDRAKSAGRPLAATLRRFPQVARPWTRPAPFVAPDGAGTIGTDVAPPRSHTHTHTRREAKPVPLGRLTESVTKNGTSDKKWRHFSAFAGGEQNGENRAKAFVCNGLRRLARRLLSLWPCGAFRWRLTSCRITRQAL